jgi:hypothetical protein
MSCAADNEFRNGLLACCHIVTCSYSGSEEPSRLLYVLVAIIWLVPDRRIERIIGRE